MLRKHKDHDLTSPVRVLVVDDDRDCADSLSTLLSKLGHECVPLNHPKIAVDYAQVFRPDLMLIDLAMPRLDGCELVRRLRKDHAISEATLVAMSGYADSAHRQMAFEAGFDAFFAKPFRLDELESLIANLGDIREKAKALRLGASELLKYAKDTNSCSAELIQLSLRIQHEWSSILETVRNRR